MKYGMKLNALRMAKGIKGTRQKVIVTHNPSEIDQNQLLLVTLPKLGSGDVIVPGIANLFFNIKLDSTDDKNRKLVSDIGRAIIKKLAVKFEGNEILSEEITTSLRVTKTCGKQNLNREMPLGKELFLVKVALRTA